MAVVVSNAASVGHSCTPPALATSCTAAERLQLPHELRVKASRCQTTLLLLSHWLRCAHRCVSSGTGGKPSSESPVKGTMGSAVPCTLSTLTAAWERPDEAKALSQAVRPASLPGSISATPLTAAMALTTSAAWQASTSAIIAPLLKPATQRRDASSLSPCFSSAASMARKKATSSTLVGCRQHVPAFQPVPISPLLPHGTTYMNDELLLLLLPSAKDEKPVPAPKSSHVSPAAEHRRQR